VIGQTLSHYKILEKLGSGGMGEVYVAEDTKLHRNVALKILPPELASDERRARFEREAQAVAALNHPNIVTVFSVEEAEGTHFITMELVKGKTLTELIPKKGMPLNKFFEVAIPLADAVSAAHGQGIIHRDLKPDNLMVSEDGRLKILDFGLAKLKPGHAGDGASELPTQSATAEGRILGTVAYMSPEQAEGKTVDTRTDIFSIGIILYEMATGERPFKGDTAASLLSSILKDTPTSATEANSNIPRDLGKIIRRCLNKDPIRRYQNAIDLRNELEELKQEVDSGEVLEGAPATMSRPKSKWPLHIALVVAIVVAGIVGYQLRLGEVPEEPADTPIKGTFTRLTSDVGREWFPSLSPDGNFVAYAREVSDSWDIYLKRVGGERDINLTADSPADDTQPAFSPDGELIAFRSERDGGGIFLMGATGESVRRLTDFGYNPAWSPEGNRIYFATEGVAAPESRYSVSQLWVVDVATEAVRMILEGDGVQPSCSPRGNRIAYWSHDNEGQRELWTAPVEGGEPVLAIREDAWAWNPVWSPHGRFLYFSSNRGGNQDLWRVAIDEASGKSLAEPESVTTGLPGSAKHPSLSRNGTRIAYVVETAIWNINKVSFDPTTGRATSEPVSVTRGSRGGAQRDPSPDGSWLAFHSFGNKNQRDIYIIRPDGTDRRQLTDDIHEDRGPRWSPDGKRIAFYTNRSGSYEIWTMRPDGSGLTQVTNTPGRRPVHPVWSPKEDRMAYSFLQSGSYLIEIGKPWNEQSPQPLPPLGKGEGIFAVRDWSPDGQWLAGMTVFPDGTFGGIVIYSLKTKRYLKLTDFGVWPRWLNDGRRLLFSDNRRIYLLDVRSKEYREILESPGFAFAISKDNRLLFPSHRVLEADIWLLTLNEEKE
jgi:serine/threonine protein kinase/dipeptidyl aminopeptidase/acylaminoacyl peptidase